MRTQDTVLYVRDGTDISLSMRPEWEKTEDLGPIPYDGGVPRGAFACDIDSGRECPCGCSGMRTESPGACWRDAAMDRWSS